MRPDLPWFCTKQALSIGAAAALSVATLAACSSSSSSSPNAGSSSSTSSANKSPISIGASLSLTGDFSDEGIAFQKGYELWQSDVNAHGGVLGRQVKLTILDDKSDPTQVQTNYQTLINSDKVDLLFGPFSSLLTTPSDSVAARAGYALVEGAGGTEAVFTNPANEADKNIFDVSLPVRDYFKPFIDWISSLSASERPKTAAYPMADDPFGSGPVQPVQAELTALGVKTVYTKIFPEENSSYKPAADQVAAAKPDLVILGSTDVPTVQAFVQAFQQQHFNPKIFLAAAGPDQGAAFTSAVGKGNAQGIMVPNGWYPGYQNASSQAMVQAYVAKYGGTASDVNANVAEAYAVGQIVADAVTATGGTDNAKIISYLHAGHTFQTVQGAVTFDSLGRNTAGLAYIFQWQQNGTKFSQVLPIGSTGSVPIIATKPNWTG
ncbi:MAG TPA: amino acid ABC transporter substrate-binding protein [Streptosporangiaceae bacterium]|nr:amino acid ABC transporter substrate-binding protein [Streptosporangiaceae bacterium]